MISTRPDRFVCALGALMFAGMSLVAAILPLA